MNPANIRLSEPNIILKILLKNKIIDCNNKINIK